MNPSPEGGFVTSVDVVRLAFRVRVRFRFGFRFDDPVDHCLAVRDLDCGEAENGDFVSPMPIAVTLVNALDSWTKWLSGTSVFD